MPELENVRGLIVDMDGVLWRGRQPLAGVIELFAWIRQRGFGCVLVTNNATASPDEVIQRLDEMGVPIQAEEVLTSAQATAQYLAGRLEAGSNLYAIGEAGLRQALRREGFDLLEAADHADAVVVGMDRQLTWGKLAEAALAINAGAAFVGTNPDPSFPTERGLVPGNGAILAALQAATGVDPTVIGKPEPHLFHQALTRLGVSAEQALVLGDRLSTDILGGQRAGIATALLLTGVTNVEDLDTSEIQPDFTFADLHAFLRAFQGAPA